MRRLRRLSHECKYEAEMLGLRRSGSVVDGYVNFWILEYVEEGRGKDCPKERNAR